MFESVLPEHAKKALVLLGSSGMVSGAYLAGGTALALQFGHRESIDFDFFTPQEFDPIALSKKLSTLGVFTQDLAKGISLLGEFHGVKFSYFGYDHPLIEPLISYKTINIAHAHDIAAMKLVAISDRNTKKDFIDLYTLATTTMSLEQMFQVYEKKYHAFEANKFTIIKSLTYFDEADFDPMPRMFTPLSWDTVKVFFLSESKRLSRQLLEN